ncbi:MAG: tetratricopeptide repeat protein [Crocosphaera sp.]|nr:tetratricopeptide repeat protein [Crocosphaera sp.]
MQAALRFKILAGVILSLLLPALVSPSWANPTVLNFISEIKGDVQLKRSQWNGYQKANMGDLLNPSDQLKLSAGASATVMCNNLRVWVVPSDKVSLVSEGCGASKRTETRPNGGSGPTRAPNETIPYIISPRNTDLLTNRPILRWNAVSGATHYKVRIQDAGLTLDWQTETSNTEIQYPGEPPLQPDSYYLLIVETDQGESSEEEQGVDLSFTVLDTQKAQSVQTEVAQLKQQKLSQEAEGIALAYLYESYNLKAEAIELLEGLVKQGNQTVAIYQLLGDLYLQVGLSKQAKSPYLQALELAKATEDVEGQAEAQFGLGQVEVQKTEAIGWLTQAQTNYQKLGDMPKVEEVQQWIKDFQ